MVSERPLFISNPEDITQHVMIIHPEEIFANPQSFTLTPESSIQVILECVPNKIGEHETSISLIIDEKDEQVIELQYCCVESIISISRQMNHFPPTLLEQTTRDEVELSNESDFPVKFSVYSDAYNDIEFDSETFLLNPLEGVMYPQSQILLQAKFTPKMSQNYTELAYIHFEGQINRIPLELQAEGTPPDVQLDCEILDYERLCIGESSACQVSILNASDVQVAFRYIEKDFEFNLSLSQKEGIIPANSKLDFEVSIQPTIMQRIDEIILFEVLNTTTVLPLQILADVVPPEIEVKIDLDNPDSTLRDLNFGVVPFGFGSRREVHLFNKSSLSQSFVLTVEPITASDQNLLSCADFNVSPHRVTVERASSLPIQVTLLPKQCKSAYNGFVLRVFAENIDQKLLEIPISAQVSSARFTIEPPVYEIPRAFVGHQWRFQLVIRNESAVVGRWLFPPQENVDSCIIQASLQSGVLAANSEQLVEIAVTPRSPGSIVVPVNFLTDDRQEMQCMIEYNATGPEMEISMGSINFPVTDVLAVSEKVLKLTNSGLSDSLIQISAQKAGSFFSIEERSESFELRAGETRDVTISLSANVAGNHKDQIIIIEQLINENCDISDEVLEQITSIRKIQVSGITKGTSLFSPFINFKEPIDCGTFFVSELMHKEIIIENHGPEPQNLTWYSGKNAILKFENPKMTLLPGEKGTFVITGISDVENEVKNQIILKTSIPGKSTDTAFVGEFVCKFVKNLVKITSEGKEVSSLEFLYKKFPLYGENEGEFFFESKITEKLTIHNLTSLPSRVELAVHSPFSVREKENSDSTQYLELYLEAGQATLDFYVCADEDYCVGEHLPCDLDSLMLVKLEPIEENSLKPPIIKMPILLECRFPCVSFRTCDLRDISKGNLEELFDSLPEQENINFNSIVPGTIVKRSILVKNISEKPIQLNWTFENVESKNYNFDITPSSISGENGLLSNMISIFEIEFKCTSAGKDGVKISDAFAVCNVDGGNHFSYELNAESSNLSVDIEPTNYNFGEISYISEEYGNITIFNTSQVKTTIQLTVPTSCMSFLKMINDIIIEKDTKNVFFFDLPRGDKIDIKFTIIPRVPGYLNIPLAIKAGHLEEVTFPITGQSYCENISLFTNEQELQMSESIIPWKADYSMPSYNAFAIAAESYLRAFPLKYQLVSTLLKVVSNDGTLECYGQTIEPQELALPIDANTQNIIVELIMTNIEEFKYELGEASRIESRMLRTRDTATSEYINDVALASLKVVQELPKNPIIFTAICELPPTLRGELCEKKIKLINQSTNPLVFNVDRKFLTAYGINVLPEKLPRIAHGEKFELTIQFLPNENSPIGDTKFVVPLFFRSSAVGFIQCSCNVCNPQLKPLNLMQLADNFVQLPIEEKESEYILNFAECLYGESSRFEIKLFNPSPIAAEYTCHINGGIGREYEIGSNETVGAAETESLKLDECFEISQSLGCIEAQEEGIISVIFKPVDFYKLKDVKTGNLFFGELKFNIKTSSEESNGKLVIKLVGLGYHPQLYFSTNEITLDPVFPKEIEEEYQSITVQNKSPNDIEIYIPEIDVIHKVENYVLNSLSNLEEKESLKSKDHKTVFLSEFARAGQFLSNELLEQLNNTEVQQLAEFLNEEYEHFISNNLEKAECLNETQDEKKPKSKEQERQAEEELKESEAFEKQYTKSSLKASQEKLQDANLSSYNEEISQENFSYEPTKNELTQLKYNKFCESLYNNESYRIAYDDATISNIPFLVYLVLGVKLCGKTSQCAYIKDQLTISEDLGAIVVSLKNLLPSSETVKQFEEEESKQEENMKGKKEVEKIDYRAKEEFISGLAEEYYQAILEEAKDSNINLIGLVFDEIESPYVSTLEQEFKLFEELVIKFAKPARYEVENVTSRVAVNLVVLDENPSAARKQKLQIISQEYEEANEMGDTALLLELKELLVNFKEQYDLENDALAHEEIDVKEFATDTIPLNYQEVVDQSDEFGQKHEYFVANIDLVNELAEELKGHVIEYHKQRIDETSNVPEEYEQYQELSEEIEELEKDLALKKANKQLQEKLEEKMKEKAELEKTLLPHPVENINITNMFSLKYEYVNGAAINNEFLFEETLFRYVDALKKYHSTLLFEVKNEEILQRNINLELINTMLNFVPLLTNDEITERLHDPSSELYKILNKLMSPEHKLEEIYEDSKQECNKEELFEIIPVSEALMARHNKEQEELANLERDTDVTPAEVKQFTKEQQQDYQTKKELLEKMTQDQSELFTGEFPVNEIGYARWIIRANSEEEISFRFYSNVVKEQQISIHIECRGCDYEVPIQFNCLCDWPHIESNLQLLFDEYKGNKSYKQDKNLFTFGNLRANVPTSDIFIKEMVLNDSNTSDMNYQQLSTIIEQESSQFINYHYFSLRLSNDSAFNSRVAVFTRQEVGDEDLQEYVAKQFDIVTEETKQKAKPEQKGKDKAKAAEEESVFYINKQLYELEPNETKYVIISAFPEEEKEFEDKIYIAVEHNPELLEFDVLCKGIQPSFEYEMPECEEELIPCQQNAQVINELGQLILSQAELKAKPKQAEKAETGKQIDKQYYDSLVILPRVSLSQENITNLPFKNTNILPIEIEFMPFEQSELKLIGKEYEYQKYEEILEPLPKIFKRDAPPPEEVVSLKFDHLYIKNIKFVLHHNEEMNMQFVFKSKEKNETIVPGKFLIKQYCPKEISSECNIESTKEIYEFYQEPLERRNIIILAEAYKSNIKIGVTKVEIGNNNAIKSLPNYQFDERQTNIVFGMCKAMNHFRAEVTIENQGQYDVELNATIVSKLKNELAFVIAEEKEESQGEKKTENLVTDKFLKKLERQIPCLEEEPDAKAKKQQSNNSFILVVDFFADSDTDLKEEQALNLTFLDKITKIPLTKEAITISARVEYAELQINPDKMIIFGDLSSGKIISKNITIENVGCFPTTFLIENINTVIKRKMTIGCYSIFDEEYEGLLQNLKVDSLKLKAFGVESEVEEIIGAEDPVKTPRSKTEKDAKVQVTSLQVGRFTITPSVFTLQPEQRQVIEVTFEAKGTTNEKETLVFDWSNKLSNEANNLSISDAFVNKLKESIIADFNANPDVQKMYQFREKELFNIETANIAKFAISGNSQIPGIDSQPASLFEEQEIQNQAPNDIANINEGVYSLLANELCIGGCELGHRKSERIKIYNPFSVETNIVFLLAPSDQKPEEAISQEVGDTISSIQEFIDRKSGKSIPQSARGKKPAEGKPKAENVTQNDEMAWTLDTNYAKILPKQSLYVTIEYKPNEECVSKFAFIAFSIDKYYKAKELSANDTKGDEFKKELEVLSEEMKEEDLKSTLVHFQLVGVGVLPEILISPEFVDFGKIILFSSASHVKTLKISNVGRVVAQFSVVLRADDSTYAECFELKGEVESKLFSGIINIDAGESYLLNIDINMQKIMELPLDTNSIRASLCASVLTSSESFENIIVPLLLEVEADDICLYQVDKMSERREQFYFDSVAHVFELPKQDNTKIVSRELLDKIADCSIFRQSVEQEMQLYGQTVELLSGNCNIFLKDLIIGEEPDFAAVMLMNQSENHYLFEINEELLQQLNVNIEPRKGHLLAGQQLELHITLMPPHQSEAAETKKKQATEQNRIVLFGNPLLIEITEIQFKNQREAILWTSDMKFDEPNHEFVINTETQQKLCSEFMEISELLGKKQKLSSEQQQSHEELSEIFDSTGNVINEGLLAKISNSNYLQLNLFGVSAPSQYKYFTEFEDGTFEALETQQENSYNQLIVSFEKISILQKAQFNLLVLNDGICSPSIQYTCEEADAPFSVQSDGEYCGRPDLLSQAVRETYPQITDSRQCQTVLQEYNIAAKGADKAAGQQLAQLYAGPQSAYCVRQRVVFQPLLPGSYNLIYTLSGSSELLCLQGQATLPICHIDSRPSAYLEKERSSSQKTPYVFSNLLARHAEDVRVIEIQGVGVGQISAGQLELTNTISEEYQIQFIRLPESTQRITTKQQSYTIQSGEKIAIQFQYVPDQRSLQTLTEEAFYIMKIEKYNIEIPVLVVGKPREPFVELSQNKLAFGQVQYGQVKEVEVKLVNHESNPHNYAVKPIKSQIKVFPQQGIIPANGSTAIAIQCAPTQECDISEVISIEISRKAIPLEFNVKYSCVKAKHILELLPENQQIGVPQVVQNVSDIDYGTVYIADERARRLKLTNVGQAVIRFSHKLELVRNVTTQRRDMIELKQCQKNITTTVEGLEPSNECYCLEPEQSCFINIIFAPVEEISISANYNLFFSISLDSIGTQKIKIQGKAAKPLLSASSQKVDFGTVLADLIYEKCQIKELVFANHDLQPLTLEYVSDSTDFYILTPPDQKPLLPGQSCKIQIRFEPVFAQAFESTLTVTVNGIYKLRYQLIGEAVANSISVSQKSIELGSILTTSLPLYKQVEVTNNSLANVNIRVYLHEDYEIPSGLFICLQENDQAPDVISRALDEMNGWNIRNNRKAYLEKLSKEMLIPGKSSASLLVFYKPYERQKAFNIPVEILVEQCKLLESVCCISGSAIGTSGVLLNNVIDLPPCLQNSSVENDFIIKNTGDVQFEFEIPLPPKNLVKRQLVELFSNETIEIEPQRGLVKSGEQQQVIVRFSPSQQLKAGKYSFPNIPVNYAFQDDIKQIGTFTINALCEDQNKFYQSAETEVHFECPAREEQTIEEKIDNSTERVFEVKTVIKGEGSMHYLVPDRLVIPPGGVEFNIVFWPLKEGIEKAQLIIPGSEGGANVFNLTGEALTPNLDGFITNINNPMASPKEEKPKTSRGKKVEEKQADLPVPQCENVITVSEIYAYANERLPIVLNNWEKKMERFHISHEMTSGEFCNFEYPEFVDVPPQGNSRQIDIIFTPYQENTEYNGYLLFSNQETKEFLKFEFKLYAQPANSVMSVSLQTTCRDEQLKNVELPNLLTKLNRESILLKFVSEREYLTLNQEIRITTREISIPLELSYIPEVPNKNDAFTIKVSATTEENEPLAPMVINVVATANSPRPSSPLKVTSDEGKSTDFSLTLRANNGEFYMALSDLSDSEQIFDCLSEKSLAKGVIYDKMQYFPQKNCFEIQTTEIACTTGIVEVQLRFSPDKMGTYNTNLIVFSKQGGIWVVPLIGQCIKAPSVGIIGFE